MMLVESTDECMCNEYKPFDNSHLNYNCDLALYWFKLSKGTLCQQYDNDE